MYTDELQFICNKKEDKYLESQRSPYQPPYSEYVQINL